MMGVLFKIQINENDCITICQYQKPYNKELYNIFILFLNISSYY